MMERSATVRVLGCWPDSPSAGGNDSDSEVVDEDEGAGRGSSGSKGTSPSMYADMHILNARLSLQYIHSDLCPSSSGDDLGSASPCRFSSTSQRLRNREHHCKQSIAVTRI